MPWFDCDAARVPIVHLSERGVKPSRRIDKKSGLDEAVEPAAEILTPP